jgi:putative aldouronate transport system substrate-binding protein
MYKDYILTMHRWKKEGLQPGDPTDSNPGQAYFAAGQLFAVVSDINSTIMAQRQADYKDFELGWVTLVEPVVTNATTTEYMWGIASNSQRPDKAMDFLNFMYENGEVANILSYGLKDVDYTFVDGSNSVIARTGSYAPTFFVGGDPEKMLILSPNGEDYVAKLKEMEANATLSPLLGYTFDDSAFQTESSVINSTILEYIPRLNNGMADSEEATLALLAEFNQKLKLSGIDDVIAANQEQINQYLKNQG